MQKLPFRSSKASGARMRKKSPDTHSVLSSLLTQFISKFCSLLIFLRILTSQLQENFMHNV